MPCLGSLAGGQAGLGSSSPGTWLLQGEGVAGAWLLHGEGVARACMQQMLHNTS